MMKILVATNKKLGTKNELSLKTNYFRNFMLNLNNKEKK